MDVKKRGKKIAQLSDAQITMQIPTDKTERKRRGRRGRRKREEKRKWTRKRTR